MLWPSPVHNSSRATTADADRPVDNTGLSIAGRVTGEGYLEQPGSLRARHASALRAVLGKESLRLAVTDGTAALAATAAWLPWRSSLVQAALCVVAFAALGLYQHRLILSATDDLLRVVAGIGLAWLFGDGVNPPAAEAGRPLAGPLAAAGCAIAGVLVARAAGYALLRRGRARRPAGAVVVGAGPEQIRLVERLLQCPQLGLRPIGFVGPAPDAGPLPVPVLGPEDELDDILARTQAENVIVGLSGVPDADLVTPLRRSRQWGGTVFVVPRLFELSMAGRGTEAIDGIPLIRLPPVPPREGWVRHAAR